MEMIETITLSREFLGLDRISLIVRAQSGYAVMLVAKAKQTSKSNKTSILRIE
jgi:hypothetical protein